MTSAANHLSPAMANTEGTQGEGKEVAFRIFEEDQQAQVFRIARLMVSSLYHTHVSDSFTSFFIDAISCPYFCCIQIQTMKNFSTR